jgi:uncharacterized membrane protein YgcG
MTRAPRLLVVALLLPAAPLLASRLPPRPSDALVHDLSGTLAPAALADLEKRADAVIRAGADVAVLVRFERADSDETRSDARRLLGERGVETAPERAEGDARHGSAAIEVGRGLARERLTSREVDRIWRESMRPALRDGRVTEGIAAGLGAVERTLREGPPPPSETSLAAADLAGGTLLHLALVAAAVAALAAAVTGRSRRRTAASPGDRNVSLGPVKGGVLARRRVGDGVTLGGLLQLGASGALMLEAGPSGVLLARPTGTPTEGTFAAALLETVVARAGETGVADLGTAPFASTRLSGAVRSLRAEMTARGLLDPLAPRRATRAAVGAGLTFAIAVLLVVAAVVGDAPGPALASVLTFGAGAALAVRAATLPETTDDGEREGAAWSAWLAELARAPESLNADVDLGAALPFVLAAGRPDLVMPLSSPVAPSGALPGWLSGSAARDGAGTAAVCAVLVADSGGGSDGGAGAGGSF